MFKIKILKSKNNKNIAISCRKTIHHLLAFGTSLSLLSGALLPSALATEPANFTASAYENHWGRSDLRAYMNGVAKTNDTLPLDTTGHTQQTSGYYESQFSDKEYALVQPYTYKTNVLTNNDLTAKATAVYETVDKFWLPSGNYIINKIISWGSEDISADTQYGKSTAADKARIIPISYWSYGASTYSWLRSPDKYNYYYTIRSNRSTYVDNNYVRYSDALAAACKINLTSVIFASAALAANLARDGCVKKFAISGSNGFGKSTSNTLPDYGMYLKTKLDSSFTVNSISLDGVNLTVDYTGGIIDKYVVVHAFGDDSLTAGTTSYAAAAQIAAADGSVTINVADWGISSLDGLTLKVWLEDGSGNLAQATLPQTFVGTTSGATKTEDGAKSNLRVFTLKKDLQTSWGDLSKLSEEEYNNVISGKGSDGASGYSSNLVHGLNPTNQKIYFGSYNGAPLEFWIAGRETAANGGEIRADGDIMTLYQAKSVEQRQFNSSGNNYQVPGKPAVILQLAEDQMAEYNGSTVSYPAEQITFKQGDTELDKTVLKWLHRTPGKEKWNEGMPSANGNYELRCYVEGTDNYERTYSAVVNFKMAGPPTADDFIFTPPENLVEDGNPKEAIITIKPEITGMGEVSAPKYSELANGTETELESPPVNAGTYQVKIDVAEGDPFTAIENLTDPSWTFTITPVPPKPEIPGDSATTPEDGDSEGSKNPSHPAEAPGKDNQNGAAADQESSLDIAKTGDNVTCFTLSTLSLATLSFGALMRSKIRNKKSD